MKISVELPSSFAKYANGERIVQVEGETPKNAIANLIVAYPELRIRLLDSQEQVYPYLVLFHNHRRLSTNELPHAAIADGDHLTITTLASGG